MIDADTSRATTITGSYNFTYAAQRGNAENVVVLRDNPSVARAYRDNWSRLKASATPWVDAAASIIISDVIPAKAGIQFGFQCQINLIGPRPAPGRQASIHHANLFAPAPRSGVKTGALKSIDVAPLNLERIRTALATRERLDRARR